MRYRLITFDVYSALFDTETTLTPVLTEMMGDPPPADGLAVIRLWRRKQMEYVLLINSLEHGRISFREVTQRALDYALHQSKVKLAEAKRQVLVEMWNHLKPWPEANEVLLALKARGQSMALLSNGDQVMLGGLAMTLPVSFEAILSSETAHFYKPHPAIYGLPLARFRLTPEVVLHVAGSANDVMGAKAAGLDCAWSNRVGEQVLDPRFKADYEFSDLRGLLELELGK